LVRIDGNRIHKKTNYARKLGQYYSQYQWLLQTLLASCKFLASHNFLFKSPALILASPHAPANRI
jgi:hypothetical protein